MKTAKVSVAPLRSKPVRHGGPLWRDIADKALASGGEKTSAFNARWSVAGQCQRSEHRELKTHRPTAGDRFIGRDLNGRSSVHTETQTLELEVRCRRCAECLKARAQMWRMRAIAETAAHPRTWFGTITLRPEEQFKALSLARLRLARQGLDFDALEENEQFGERHAVISKEITKYLKRLRKQSGSKFRIILVAEAHKSGAPHYHLLVHETNVSEPIRHAVLTGQWKLGFTNFKLVNGKSAASYVCKYLAKSAAARVRASVGYGKTSGLYETASSHSSVRNVKGEEPLVVKTPTTPQTKTPFVMGDCT